MAVQQVQRYEARMKKTKARLSGITQEKEMQIEEPHDLKSGAT